VCLNDPAYSDTSLDISVDSLVMNGAASMIADYITVFATSSIDVEGSISATFRRTYTTESLNCTSPFAFGDCSQVPPYLTY
jgi:hypothetical protein